MAKKQGVKRTKNSQIDYATRRQMELAEIIAAEREHANKQLMKMACVALNESEHLGFTRICRFALELKKTIAAVNADPERAMYHIDNRLRKMGFTVDGVSLLAAQDENGNIIKFDDLPEDERHDLEPKA